MFIFVSVFCFGFLYLVRGYFMKSFKQIAEVKEDVEKDDLTPKYEDRYHDVLEKVRNVSKNVSKNVSNNNNNFLMETTPNGNVIMKYNNERESFEYYSDKDIPYKYLETVARKFVKTFFCYEYYILTKLKFVKVKGNMVRQNEKNRFTHLGKINNFNMLQTTLMKSSSSSSKFSYKKFKTLF